MRPILLSVLLLLPLTGFAGPADDTLLDPEDELEEELELGDEIPDQVKKEKKDDEDELRFDEIEDDDMPDFSDMKAPPPKPKPASKKAEAKSAPKLPYLDATGMDPLHGDFDLRIVMVGEDTVTFELPLLLATSPDNVEDAWVMADFLIDGTKVGEQRLFLTKKGMSIFSPTFGFLKAQVPVQNPTGVLEVVVFKADENGKNPKELFKKQSDYKTR